MRALAVLLAAVALPALAAPRQKVAVLDVRAVQGVAAGTATILTAIIAGDTSRAGYDVLSQADIGALIGFEKQKKMLGCGDDSSCLAEIGGALGAEYVMATQVGQIGSRFHLSLQIIDGKKGNVVARVSTFSERTEDALAETAQKAVAEALATARERNESARTAKVAAATPTPTPTSTPTPIATPTPTATATRAPVPPSPSSRTGESFLARRPPYVEVNVGTGKSYTKLTDAGGDGNFNDVALAVRGGIRWTPQWSFELGGGYQDLVRNEDGFDYDFGPSGVRSFTVDAQLRTLFVSAGAEWRPLGNRLFGVAADVGVARAAVRNVYQMQRNAFDIAGSPFPGEGGGSAVRWRPRASAELRLDYPLRWVTLGLRAGVVYVANLGTHDAPLFTPLPSPTPTDPPRRTYLSSGATFAFPVSASVRYVF